MNALTSTERDALARELGLNERYLYQCLAGHREMDPAQAVLVERRSGLRLRRWHLRTKTWSAIWPELVGTEGAPDAPGLTDEREAA